MSLVEMHLTGLGSTSIACMCWWSPMLCVGNGLVLIGEIVPVCLTSGAAVPYALVSVIISRLRVRLKIRNDPSKL